MLQHELNHIKIPTTPDKSSNTKKRINNFNQEGINFPSGKDH